MNHCYSVNSLCWRRRRWKKARRWAHRASSLDCTHGTYSPEGLILLLRLEGKEFIKFHVVFCLLISNRDRLYSPVKLGVSSLSVFTSELVQLKAHTAIPAVITAFFRRFSLFVFNFMSVSPWLPLLSNYVLKFIKSLANFEENFILNKK